MPQCVHVVCRPEYPQGDNPVYRALIRREPKPRWEIDGEEATKPFRVPAPVRTAAHPPASRIACLRPDGSEPCSPSRACQRPYALVG
jgi:hypothetical protein